MAWETKGSLGLSKPAINQHDACP